MFNIFRFRDDYRNIKKRLDQLEKDSYSTFERLDKISTKSMNNMRKYNNELFYNHNCILNKDKYNKSFNPKVSIIIPVYNGENYVSLAIDSALNQTYKNIEIIVVNDGSKDNTEAVCKKYGKKIKYIKKENGGVSTALNVGIKNMTGEYFSWLSHDDIILENHIEELVEFLRYFDDGKTIGYSCWSAIGSDGKPKDVGILPLYCDYTKSLYTHYACILQGDVNGGSVLIPKKAIDKYGGFEEGNVVSQEKEMWSRLLKGYKFINIPKVTYLIRIHDKQVSSTNKDVASKTNEAIIKIIDNITDKEKIEESGSIYNFYFELYEYYYYNSNFELADKFKEKLKDL